MSKTVSTGDIATVAACPECDAADVRRRPIAGADYRCSTCAALFDEYAVRENRRVNDRREYAPDEPILVAFRDRGAPPDRVWVSSRNAEQYHREDCPRLSETPTSRPLAIARAWETFDACDYCIGTDDADADAQEAIASD